MIGRHSSWTLPIIFIVTFAESFAFLSLLFPGTTIMIAAGILVANGTLPVAPVLIGGIAGAVLGDGVSYWLGKRYGRAAFSVWPLSRSQTLLARGERLFQRYGALSVFIGRFFGPLRAVIPLVAGIVRMPARRFWFANIA
jgi:membrane protein DedA with SNARE-associated domain